MKTFFSKVKDLLNCWEYGMVADPRPFVARRRPQTGRLQIVYDVVTKTHIWQEWIDIYTPDVKVANSFRRGKKYVLRKKRARE